MPKKIDAKTDFEILADLALKMSYKDIAKKHGVSLSYVSKVKTGKKKIDVYIPEGLLEESKLMQYRTDVDSLVTFFKTLPLSLQGQDIDNLDEIIINKLKELKILLNVRELLKK